MFENFSSLFEDQEVLDESLRTSITQHIQSLENEIKRYFPELKENKAAVVRNPFSCALDVADIPDELQHQFCDLRNDSSARDVFHEIPLSQFWCTMYKSYPQLSEIAF